MQNRHADDEWQPGVAPAAGNQAGHDGGGEFGVEWREFATDQQDVRHDDRRPPARFCAGGMLCTFADMQMAAVIHYQCPEIAGHRFPTINLTTDFAAPVPPGAWLEGTSEVIRATKTLVFMHGSAAVEGATALRFNGVFKIGPKRDYANPRDPYDLLPSSHPARK